MVRFKYVYWCIGHQQYVVPRAKRELRDNLRCRIVRLNLTLLEEVDFHKFSTFLHEFQHDHIRRGLEKGESPALKEKVG